MIYLFVLIGLIFLMYIYDIKGKEVYRDNWYVLVLVTLVAISGLRYRIGGDTVNYLYSYYHEVPCIWDISVAEWENLGYEPLFFLFSSLVKSLGVRFFVFQFLHALFVNSLIFIYFKRHSEYIFTCIFFYFIWIYVYCNFEEMRASMSLVVCLFANDYIIDRKWIRGFSLYIIGFLFHYSTIVLFITPLFLFLRMNLLGLIYLLIALVSGYIIQKSFGDYLMLLDLNGNIADKAMNYANKADYFEQSKSLRGIIIAIIPYIVYSIISVAYLRHNLLKASEKKLSLIRLQPFLLLGLTFVLFSIPMPIADRFIRFYQIYFILYFSNLFTDWINSSTQISHSIGLVRSFIVFIPIFNIISHMYRDPIKESSKNDPYYSYEKYVPYSSIIEKSVSGRREHLYNMLSSINLDLRPNEEEY